MLATLRAPKAGAAGRLTLTVHVPPIASGAVNEQVVPARLRPPVLSVRVSPVIANGALPVLVIVTTLVTAALGLGVMKVRVRTPRMVDRAPLVALV